MQPLQWEHRPDGLRAPALVCAFKGWNDAADAASSAIQFVGSALGARALRHDRPRGVLRLPGHPAAGQDGRRPGARDRLAGGGAVRGPGPARAARPDPAVRLRAVVSLAHVQPARRRAGRGARHPAGGDARRAAGRRPPHPPGVGHRADLRSGAGRPARAWPPPPTRARPGSSGSSTPPASRPACPRRACGRPSPTTSPPPPTPRRRWRWCASSRGWSAWPSTAPSSRSAAADYERQVNVAVQSDPDVQAFVERLEQAASEEADDAPDLAALRRDDRPRPAALPAPARRRAGVRRPTARAVTGDRGSALGRRDTPAGSRTSSRPRTTASAQSPADWIPSATSVATSHTQSARSPSSGHRHLLVVEQVVVGLAGGLQPPRLARADRVQRQLDVVGQLVGALGPAGLVVDQLVLAAGQQVDPVDAPAQQVAARA